MQYDLKPLFNWAKSKGDANIYDRILVKIVPVLLKNNFQITTQIIETSNEILVPNEVYQLTLEKAQELVGEKYEGRSDV